MTSPAGSEWRAFARNHWRAFVILALAAALALAGSVYVFLWYVAGAQSSGAVPRTLALWTMGNIISFALHVVFWELVLIGIPVAVAGVAGWMWWRGLPDHEKRGLNVGGTKSSSGGGGVGLFLFIAFAIKVYLDGNWNVPIANFTVDYVVGSMVTILVWGLVILGIPAAIALAWWLNKEMRA